MQFVNSDNSRITVSSIYLESAVSCIDIRRLKPHSHCVQRCMSTYARGTATYIHVRQGTATYGSVRRWRTLQMLNYIILYATYHCC